MRKKITMLLLLCIWILIDFPDAHAMSAGNPKPRILVLTLLDSDVGSGILREAAERMSDTAEVDYYHFGFGYDVTRPMPADLDIASYQAVLVYEHGVFLTSGLKERLESAKETTTLIVMNAYSIDSAVDVAQHPFLQQYWDNMSSENAYRMLYYIAVTFCGIAMDVLPPIEYPNTAFYHPDSDSVFETPADYLEWYAGNRRGNHRWSADAPSIGILFYKSIYTKQKTGLVDTIIRRIESEGANAMPLYSKSNYPIDTMFVVDEKEIVDTIITLSNSLDWSDREHGVEMAKAVDVPILFGKTHFYQSPQEWEESDTGLSVDSMPGVVYAEMSGIIEPTVISGKMVTENGDRYNQPIDYQVDWLVGRALSWTRLHRLDNSEKKIAITYWSEGGGKHDVGADIDYYLDAPASLEKLLREMKSRGYDVGDDPLPDADGLIESMSERGSNMGVWDKKQLRNRVETYPENTILIPESRYLEWFDALPANKRNDVIETWGEPPGNVMVYEKDGERFIVIPKVAFGNVLLLPNPTWGLLQNDKVLYGKGSFPPHHQYIAFWHWINEEFRANAVITVFSQLALMPGKQVGISRHDWGGILLQELPHILPFPIQGNGGVTNKRRTQALIVDYLPTIVTSELYEELLTLEQEIAHYRQSDGALRERYRQSILKQCKDAKLDQDLSLDIETVDFASLVDAVETYLEEVRAEQMPFGPHILSEPPKDSELIELLHSMLGKEYVEAVTRQSSKEGLDKALIEAVTLKSTSAAAAQQNLVGHVDEDITGYLNLVLDYAERVLAADREIPQLLAALDGRYIEPGPCDDPIRNPDAVPTGRNPYSFDARNMPTREAWEIGCQLANDIIAQHLEEHGEYPRKVAFVLWSSEAVKHHGVMESEILSLMGLEPVWDKRNRVTDVKLIPSSELQRPRIDVMVNTSSLYRENFQEKIMLLDKAARLVAELDEPQNYIRKNADTIREQLIAQGYGKDVADDLSRARIFSEAMGAHSPNIQFAIQAGDTWKDDKDLSDLYVNRASYIYGENHLGVEGKDVYRENLMSVDVGVFSRSSNVYGVLDHEMVAAYLGGLNMAVRNTSGKSISMFISNLRDTDKPKAETLSHFFSRELRSRYFNPKWIEGMKEHGYDGTRYIQEFTGDLWLWDVTSPDVVTEDMWNEVNDVYIDDKYDLDMQEYFEENNPYAMQSIVATMIEAKERDYWHPTQEVFENLVRIYAESVAQHGISGSRESADPSMNTTINEALSKIPNISAELLQNFNAQVEKAVTKTETVKGYEMEEVEQKDEETTPVFDRKLLSLIGMAFVMLCLIWAGWRIEKMRYAA